MEFGVFYKHRQLGAVCNYKLLKKKQIVYYQMFTWTEISSGSIVSTFFFISELVFD